MKNNSVFSSRHGPLILHKLMELAGRPLGSRWSVAYVLPLLIPVIIVIVQANARRRRLNNTSGSPSPISDTLVNDAISTDPGLLKKHSTYVSYHVPETGFTYPSIRTFYRPHPQRDKLPAEPDAIPLLVFVHGLGGSIAQFYPLLTSLVNCADSLAIDLPGCGLSSFDPKVWAAYTTEALVHLLAVAIDQYRDKEHDQKVVLICHSMGSSLGCLLASSTSPYSNLLSHRIVGMIAICPVAEPPAAQQAQVARRVLSIMPVCVFDLWRRIDKRGGVNSKSIIRFTGEGSDLETRKLQLRFNEQSKSPVWLRMAYGCLPDYTSGKPVGGIPGGSVWMGLKKMPLYLVAGEADHITSPSNVHKIAAFLGREPTPPEEHVFDEGEHHHHLSFFSIARTEVEALTALGPDAITTPANLAASCDAATVSSFEENVDESRYSTYRNTSSSVTPAFKTCIFPAPASHALLYATRTARPLSGFIQTFLGTNVDYRLSLGWQLQYLTTEGKWDVKNLEKWKSVQRVSAPIASVFRALKTLREIDDKHSPSIFVREWGPRGGSPENQGQGKDGLGAVAAVVDISHEAPVYDPNGLEKGGIAYYKFPTVSKLPPTVDEVKKFMELIDRLREDFHVESTDSTSHLVIGVHCHYGFNRTGFFLVSYLVERLNWRLKDAIKEFKEKRSPGIRHAHFIDELWSRYWERDGGRREDIT